jgi:hypothetical protein
LPNTYAFWSRGTDFSTFSTSTLEVVSGAKSVGKFVCFAITIVIDPVANFSTRFSSCAGDPFATLTEPYTLTALGWTILYDKIRSSITVVVDVVAFFGTYGDGAFTPYTRITGLASSATRAETFPLQVFVGFTITVVINIVASFR